MSRPKEHKPESILFAAVGVFRDVDEPLRSQVHLLWDSWLNWAKAHPTEHAVVNLLHQSGLASEVFWNGITGRKPTAAP